MGSLFSNPGFDPARDIPNLTGKRVVVTGANSGIGYHTVSLAHELMLKISNPWRFAKVKHLLRRGATVWMACRNERKAEDAMKRLDQYFANLGLRLGHGGVGDVKYLNCDLSSPARAKAAAAELMTKERRLDILSMAYTYTYSPPYHSFLLRQLTTLECRCESFYDVSAVFIDTCYCIVCASHSLLTKKG